MVGVGGGPHRCSDPLADTVLRRPATTTAEWAEPNAVSMRAKRDSSGNVATRHRIMKSAKIQATSCQPEATGLRLIVTTKPIPSSLLAQLFHVAREWCNSWRAAAAESRNMSGIKPHFAIGR